MQSWGIMSYLWLLAGVCGFSPTHSSVIIFVSWLREGLATDTTPHARPKIIAYHSRIVICTYVIVDVHADINIILVQVWLRPCTPSLTWSGFEPITSGSWTVYIMPLRCSSSPENHQGLLINSVCFTAASSSVRTHFQFLRYLSLHIFIHSPVHTHTNLCTHSHVYPRTCALTHMCTHSRMHSLAHPLTCAPTHLCAHSLVHPLTCKPTHLCAHTLVCPLTCAPTHLRTHSLVRPLTCVPTHLCTHSLANPLTSRTQAPNYWPAYSSDNLCPQ